MAVATGSFTANSQTSGSVEGNHGDLVVGGTFVGTVALQVSIPGASGADQWVTINSLTAPGVLTTMLATGRKFRATTTAFTSGTAYYSLGAATNEDLLQ